MINIIAAVSDNNVIGVHGMLPWVLPSDLANFRELTIGNTIVMGWNTWESIGSKPLANRKNLILSRTKKPIPRNKNVKLYNNVQQLLIEHPDIWVIGGESLYRYFMPLADKMYITEVLKRIDTNGIDKVSYFPTIDKRKWDIKRSAEVFVENDIPYIFAEYTRK